MLAIILTSPPHSLQVSVSIPDTRFNRFAQVIEARLFDRAKWLKIKYAGGKFREKLSFNLSEKYGPEVATAK
jgi:hypothetical protein